MRSQALEPVCAEPVLIDLPSLAPIDGEVGFSESLGRLRIRSVSTDHQIQYGSISQSVAFNADLNSRALYLEWVLRKLSRRPSTSVIRSLSPKERPPSRPLGKIHPKTWEQPVRSSTKKSKRSRRVRPRRYFQQKIVPARKEKIPFTVLALQHLHIRHRFSSRYVRPS